MKLNAKQRQHLIEKLTTNCECWKGDEGVATLEAFSDDQLKAIADGQEAVTIAENAVIGFTDHSTGREFRYNPEKSDWEGTVIANVDDDDDDDEEEEDDDASAIAKRRKKFKKMAKYAGNQSQDDDDEILGNSIPALTKQPRWKNTDEWFNDPRSAPPEVKEIVANGKRVINRQKQRLVETLVGNIEDDKRREALTRKYMAKDLTDLSELVEIKLAGNADAETPSYQDPFALPGYAPMGYHNPYALTDNEANETLDLDADRAKYSVAMNSEWEARGAVLRGEHLAKV